MMHNLWEMGGYGAYVWSAYGLVVVLLGINGWRLSRQCRLALLSIAIPEKENAPESETTTVYRT